VTNPARNLQISDSAAPTIRLQDTGGTNQYAELFVSGSSVVLQARNDTADGNIIFRGIGGAVATEHMRINSSGNVGIGTTSPSSTLELNVSSGNLELKLNGATATHGIRNQSDGSFGHYDYTNSRWLDLRSYAADYYALFTAGAERMRIDSSGNVGIGIASPQELFHLQKTGGSTIRFQNPGVRVWNIGNDSTSFVFDDVTAGAERMRIDSAGNLKFDSGYGSAATAYGCRAWVNFNGTGTVSIRESGNVSSITDSGTGNYTVNFTTSMPDVNYSAVCSGFRSAGNEAVVVPDSFVTGGVGVNCTTGGGGEVDFSKVCVAVFR
jgi:hypothetical protein